MLLSVGALGCPDDPSPIDEPAAERCDDIPVEAPQNVRDLEIGVLEHSRFVPLADGDAMALISGNQGGYMVLPALRIEAGDLTADHMCCRVILQQQTTPDLGVEPGLQQNVQFDREESFLQSGYLQAFLAFDSDGLIGAELLLAAEVRGVGFDAERSVRVRISSP